MLRLRVYRHEGLSDLFAAFLSGSILAILCILEILIQTNKKRAREIKVLSDLFAVVRLHSIDIKVFQTFAPCCCVSS